MDRGMLSFQSAVSNLHIKFALVSLNLFLICCVNFPWCLSKQNIVSKI